MVIKYKDMKTGYNFLEDEKGNKSSSRLIGVTAIVYALLQSTLILVFGHVEGASVIVTASASSANFLAIAGPAMVYLFNNKKEELNKTQI
jgi:hypothetical protein